MKLALRVRGETDIVGHDRHDTSGKIQKHLLEINLCSLLRILTKFVPGDFVHFRKYLFDEYVQVGATEKL